LGKVKEGLKKGGDYSLTKGFGGLTLLRIWITPYGEGFIKGN